MSGGGRLRRGWSGSLAAVLCASGLAWALGCLAKIGPPPAVRVDGLWVQEHGDEVRLCAGGIAVAAAGAVVALVAKRGRWWAALLWGMAGVITAAWFSDAVGVIATVLWAHAW